ncbi:MAG TPA: Fe-S-containing protein [Terriglobales bacterium]|nr:Fe-S-containing protein [Terriglobales bacterium]
MLQALVVTLREGVEAALIVGIVLTYLRKIGREDLHKTVYAALGASLVGSVLTAIALEKTSFNPELFEGIVMLVAAFFVVTMIWFMARAAKHLKKDIESKVERFSSTGSKVGLFIFTFLLVLREGVETVLILSAVSFTTTELMGFLGTLIGVGLSLAFGVMFVRGSVRIDLGKFFRVTTVILIFVAVQLTVSGLHELSESGYLPSSKRQMQIIGPIVRNDVFFFVTVLALAALMLLFEQRRRQPSLPDPDAASKAEARKAAWSARREKLWTTSVYVSSFVFIFLVTAQFIYAKTTTALSPAAPLTFVNGQVSLTTSDMRAGELRRYSLSVQGHETRFLIYKKPDGKVVSIMDACAICGPVGFYNSGTQGLTCKNCDAPINPSTVGDGGGCNPIPLVSTIAGDKVTIAELDLSNAASQIKE